MNDCLKDEKEAFMSRQEMIKTDSDYAEWNANWLKHRSETKKVFANT